MSEARPEGAPEIGETVVQAELAVVGRVRRYHASGTYVPPPVEGGPPDPPPIDAWCVELESGDVLLWRPEAFSVLSTGELVLLGGAAAGTEALFRELFRKAQGIGIPFGRTLEIVGYAFQAQLAAVGRAVDQAAKAAALPPVG